MPWNRVLNFSDPSECRIQSGHVEVFPTARGTFRAEVGQIGMNRLWMSEYHVTLPVVSTFAIRPDRRAISFFTESNSATMQHCGVELSARDIVIGYPGVVHFRCGAGVRSGGMSLPADELSAMTEAIVGRGFPEKFSKRVVRPNPALMSRLLKLHQIVGQLAHDTPDILEQAEVRRALEEQTIHVMIRCLVEGVGIETTTGTRRHDAIIDRFEAFLESNPDRSLYLTEICSAIGAAERTLRAACEEHLGMGPIRYLTLRRMHLVRRALLRADPLNSTVTRIVTDHGFWELGRFSVAYRTLFGETPSETLRRPEPAAINLNRPSSLPVARALAFH
jgi:AraC-like DNA-binding protein